MKKITIIILILFESFAAWSQSNKVYDSLHVYYVTYTSTFPTVLSENYLKIMGDSMIFYDAKKNLYLLDDLISMKKPNSKENIERINRKYSKYSIDVRLLFEFYSEGKIAHTIGVSYLPYMSINDVVYESDNKKLNCINTFSEKLFNLSGLDYYFR